MCKRNNIQVIVEQLPEPIDHPIYDKESQLSRLEIIGLKKARIP